MAFVLCGCSARLLYLDRRCLVSKHANSQTRSTVAGPFCHSGHTLKYQPQQQQQGWQEPQSLEHRSQSFPVGGMSHFSATRSHCNAQETVQPQTDKQSAQQETCLPPHSHSASALFVPSSPAWSLQDQGPALSSDSRSSEMTLDKKRKTVLVWDLDETLILFHSLLSGVFASHHSPEVRVLAGCGCLCVGCVIWCCIRICSDIYTCKILPLSSVRIMSPGVA